MGVKKSAKAEMENAEIKLKAAKNAHLQPGSDLKTGRASNQSGATAMNTAVAKDAARQEQENEETASKVKDAEDNVHEKSKVLQREQDAEKEKTLAEVELEKEIERRAEARFQEKMAAVPKSITASVPTVVDPLDHNLCCHRATKIIDYISKLLPGLPIEKAAMSVWLGMLDKLAIKTKALSKTPPKFDVPAKMLSFGKIKGDFGSDRKNDILMNEFRGHCKNLLSVLDNFSGNWQKPLVTYTKSLMKAIE